MLSSNKSNYKSSLVCLKLYSILLLVHYSVYRDFNYLTTPYLLVVPIDQEVAVDGWQNMGMISCNNIYI